MLRCVGSVVPSTGVRGRVTTRKIFLFVRADTTRTRYVTLSIKNGKVVTFITQLNDQTVLFDPLSWPYQMLSLWARVDLEAMAMKSHSAFPKAPALQELNHQIVQCHKQDTRRGESLNSVQKCSRCILQPQPTVIGIYVLVNIRI